MGIAHGRAGLTGLRCTTEGLVVVRDVVGSRPRRMRAETTMPAHVRTIAATSGHTHTGNSILSERSQSSWECLLPVSPSVCLVAQLRISCLSRGQKKDVGKKRSNVKGVCLGPGRSV